MKDFILASLPFIIIGICVAIIVVNNRKNKNKESYISEGMCLGMSFGLLVGASFRSEHLGMFLSLGMLVGEAIGSSLKKDRQ